MLGRIKNLKISDRNCLKKIQERQKLIRKIYSKSKKWTEISQARLCVY